MRRGRGRIRSCDPNQGAACAGGRVCVTGACLKPCAEDAGLPWFAEREADASSRMAFRSRSNSVQKWRRFRPRHSVASYALNKFEVAILMGAHVFIRAGKTLQKVEDLYHLRLVGCVGGHLPVCGSPDWCSGGLPGGLHRCGERLHEPSAGV